MASEVDIANLALAHLGDNATVASLSPPEGSAQAEHAARFYPIGRDTLLESHTWGFATKRITLAAVTNDWAQWDFAYARPSNCLRVISVMSAEAADDLEVAGVQVPQEFSCEIFEDGTQVILTDTEDAQCRYLSRVTDTNKYPNLFVTALSWHLAGMLAGPVIKGDAGAAEAKRCMEFAGLYLRKAIEADNMQRRVQPTHTVSWISGR